MLNSEHIEFNVSRKKIKLTKYIFADKYAYTAAPTLFDICSRFLLLGLYLFIIRKWLRCIPFNSCNHNGSLATTVSIPETSHLLNFLSKIFLLTVSKHLAIQLISVMMITSIPIQYSS